MNPRLVVGGAVALAALHLARYADPAYVLDDAWISFRAARSWVETGAPVFNREGAPTEAMTNLGWTALSALGQMLVPAASPAALARVGGALAWLAAVAVAVAAVLRRSGTVAGALTTLLLVSAPSLAFHAMSGLETAAWCALLAPVLAAFGAGPLGGRARVGVGVLLGAAFTLRPEGLLYGPLLVGLLALHRPERARWAVALLPFGLVVAAVELWRWATFGALVPNTFYAKPPDAAAGLVYLGRFVRSTGLALPIALVLGLGDRTLRGPSLFGVGVLAAVTWSGGDWMDGFRRLSEVALVLAGVLGVAAAAPGRRRTLAGVGAATWLLASVVAAWNATDDRRSRFTRHVEVAERAAADPGIRRVALADIGRFGWIFPREILDTGGLADPVIARAEGAHGEKWSDAWFRTQHPDLLVAVGRPGPEGSYQFAGPDLPMLRSALVDGDYYLHTSLPDGDQTLLLLFPTDRPGDPARWGASVPPTWTTGLRAFVLGATR